MIYEYPSLISLDRSLVQYLLIWRSLITGCDELTMNKYENFDQSRLLFSSLPPAIHLPNLAPRCLPTSLWFSYADNWREVLRLDCDKVVLFIWKDGALYEAILFSRWPWISFLWGGDGMPTTLLYHLWDISAVLLFVCLSVEWRVMTILCGKKGVNVKLYYSLFGVKRTINSVSQDRGKHPTRPKQIIYLVSQLKVM